MKNFVHCTTRN